MEVRLAGQGTIRAIDLGSQPTEGWTTSPGAGRAGSRVCNQKARFQAGGWLSLAVLPVPLPIPTWSLEFGVLPACPLLALLCSAEPSSVSHIS